MKKVFSVVVAIAALSFSLNAAPFSYSQSMQGWYMSGTAGLGLPSDSDYSNNIGSGSVSSDLGFGVAAALGYEVGNFRIEAEYAYRKNDGDIESFNGVAVSGKKADLSFHAIMVNLLYDFYLTDSVYWYNGGGAGVSFTNVKTQFGSDDDTVFAWQLITGLGFDISNNVSLTFGYRIFKALDSNYTLANTAVKTENPFINSLEMGIRYNF